MTLPLTIIYLTNKLILTNTILLYMKKFEYNELLIHSLELKVFLLELDRNLVEFNIEKPKSKK